MKPSRAGLALLALLPAGAATAADRPLLVLLSVDGLHPSYVLEADRLGYRAENLRRLVKEGAFARAVTGVLPTVTYPSHATIVTGVAPARHGIFYNGPFDPLGRNLNGWHWYAEDLRVPALWDAAAEAGLEVSSVDWPVTVGARVRWNIVQFWRTEVADAPDDRKLSRLLSTPGLLAEAERVLGPYPSGYFYEVAADRRRAAFNAWVLEAKRPALHFGYFSALDEEQHLTWPGSSESVATLEAIDGLVGEVRAAAERAGKGRAVVAVVSDHGHARTTRELRLNEALRGAGLIFLNERGKATGWKAFAWGSGGTAAVMLKDPSDAATRGTVRAILEALAARPDSPIQRILEGEAARSEGGFPGAAFVVGVKPDVRLTGRMEEPVLAAALPRGSHGHLPQNPEVDAAFFIAGPGVPAGRDLGRIDMRDIAPTLAARLGLRLSQAEGRDLLGGPITSH
jgi:predicted AlkP superfamily pyrophosphatase or phosphodiesterase